MSGTPAQCRFLPSTRPFWSLLTRKARRSSPLRWLRIGRLQPGERIVQCLRGTISPASAWPRIVASASWPALKPRATGRCGWLILSTSFVPFSRCCSHWNAKPVRPLARKTRRRTSLPGPQARPLWQSVSPNMHKRITPVRRPWHSPIPWPYCSHDFMKRDRPSTREHAGVPEHERRHTVPQAASSFHLD